MSLGNIRRDSTWIDLKPGNFIDWSKAYQVKSNMVCNNTGMVNYDISAIQAKGIVTTTKGQTVAIGTLMAQIPGDNIPYRVKAMISGKGVLVIGYAQKKVSGISDSIVNPFHIYFDNRYDDIIMVPPASMEYRDRSLIFAIATLGARKSEEVVGNISVQNLALKSPQMTYTVP